MNEEEMPELDLTEDEAVDDTKDNKLIAEFEAHCEKHSKKIRDKVDEASKALREAVKLSEKYGVPFCPNISFLSNSYVPTSFTDSKFSSLDSEDVSEITGAYGEYFSELLSEGGWSHSAVC